MNAKNRNASKMRWLSEQKRRQVARTKRWSTNKYYFWIKWKRSVVRVEVRKEYEHVLCHKSMRIHIKMSVLQSVALKFLSTYNLIYSRDSISRSTSTLSLTLALSISRVRMCRSKKKDVKRKTHKLKKASSTTCKSVFHCVCECL